MSVTPIGQANITSKCNTIPMMRFVSLWGVDRAGEDLGRTSVENLVEAGWAKQAAQNQGLYRTMDRKIPKENVV